MEIGNYRDGTLAATERGYEEGARWGATEATPAELQRLADALRSFRVDTSHSSPGLIFMRAVMELFGERAELPAYSERLSHATSLHYWTGFAAGAMEGIPEVVP